MDATLKLDDVAPGPERDTVLAMADEGWLRAQRGEVGLFAADAFRAQVKNAAFDDVITPDEVKHLQGFAADFLPTPGADPARDASLAAKRDEEDDLYTLQSCDFDDGDERVRVSLYDYVSTEKAKKYGSGEYVDPIDHVVVRGSHVLEVRSSDADASRRLAEALVTNEAKDGPIGLEAFKELVKAQGYRASDCSEQREDDGGHLSCDVTAEGRDGTASLTWRLNRYLTDPVTEISDGFADVRLTRVTATARVYARDRAKAQMELLRSP